MRIYVVEPNVFAGDDLVPGEEYEVKPCEDGTLKQNSAFHALVQEYWVSGCHSYDVKSFLDFRDVVKYYLGAGVEEYQRTIGSDGKRLEYPITDYRLKSWADYTKKERKESIQNLIAEMHQAQVHSKKFYEILEGLNSEKL